MKFYLLVFLLFHIINSLVAQIGVNINKVNSIYVELDDNQEINKGKTVEYRVKAKMRNGKIKDITKSNNLKLEGEGIKLISSDKILILPSEDCSKKKVSLSFIFFKKDISISQEYDLALNYRGNIQLDFSGAKGKDVDDGGNGAFKGAIFKDGAVGESGTSGYDGEDGKDLKLLMVQDSVSLDAYY